MFERFTDRARRVVVLAQEEARLLHHDSIGTEHLLLGLLHEGEGVAAEVLTSLDVSLVEARARVADIIGSGGQAPSGHIPFTPRAKKVLELALREALQLGHNYIGTEHILLGMIREGEGVAAQVLIAMGVDLPRVRRRVVQVVKGLPVDEPSPVRRLGAGIRTPTGIAPATCGFCATASPECGALFTGHSGALICEHCIDAAATPTSTELRVARGARAFIPRRQEAQSVEELAAAHEPTGPPPEDEADARAAIEVAFMHVASRTPDGRGLVHVHEGDDLGPCQDLLDQRHGAMAARVHRTIDHVKFLNPTEAVVWTSILFDGRPIATLRHVEGRAVCIDGHWKMTRATRCAELALAGVPCPPREPPAA